jgi:aminopeptidase YwaD
MNNDTGTILKAIAAQAGRLTADFHAICDAGGRLQGSSSLDASLDFVRGALRGIGTGSLSEARVRYHGWTPGPASIVVAGMAGELKAAPLIGSVVTPPEGLELEVLDLGRGTAAEVAKAGDAVRGKAVLLQHEYPFSTNTVHRRIKLEAASAAGAAAAIMVQPIPNLGPVSGGANRCPIPAFGLGIEDAERLLAAGRARFCLSGDGAVAEAVNLILDIPGAGPGRVVLSAHLDGHPMAESAMDNATGVAAALTLARVLAPRVATMRRGLTVCVFSAEEWSLSGSRAWLKQLPRERIGDMAMNINLDSIAGSPNLTALVSGFPALSCFVSDAAREVGGELRIHEPIMVNSDHANFAGVGVPALRLIAGFNEPTSPLARLLTAGDTRDQVSSADLLDATLIAAAVTARGLAATEGEINALRQGAIDAQSALTVLAPLPD